MWIRRFGWLLAWAALALAWGAAAAGEPPRAAIAGLAVLEDPAGTRTIEDVSASADFLPLRGGLSAGYTDKVHWLRFTVAPPAAGTWWLLVEPVMLDDVRLYAPQPGAPGRYTETHGGNAVPPASRPLGLREVVLPVQRPDAQPATYYLRVQTRSASLVQLALFSPLDFLRRDALVTSAIGAYFGCLALLIVQHVMHWLWRGEMLSRYFALNLLATVAVSLGTTGYLHRYLVADPALASQLRLVAICVLLPLSAPFYWRLLGLAEHSRALQGFYALVLCLPLAMAIVAVSGQPALAFAVIAALAVVANLVGLRITARQARARVPGARFALAAYGLALATVLVTSLPASGLSASAWLLQYAHQIGAMAVALSFHLALVRRLREQELQRTVALERADAAERDMQREVDARRQQAHFIAMLSHELKTPLAMIDGALQSLLHLLDQPEGRRRLERMRRAVRRIDLLVEQFLRADRLDESAIRLQAQTLDVADLCSRVRQESAHGERILLRAAGALPVQADAALLRVALVNLIDNAAKYSGPDSEIELAARGGGGMAEITVADRGPGVPQELVPRLFERYVRGPLSCDIPGTGLGLHLVNRVAQLHGGSASYTARDGGGSVFSLRLPLEGRA